MRGIVFDLDGTLIHSAPDVAINLNRALAALGHATLPQTAIERMVGEGARMLVLRALAALGEASPSDDQIDALTAGYLAAYRAEPVAETTLYPGVAGMLDRLTAEGVAIAICTNKPTDLTQSVLDRLDLTRHFPIVIGSTSGYPRKPAPEPLRAALGGLGLAPENALMVGDTHADVGAARATGTRIALVRYGYSAVPVDDLAPDHVLERLGYDEVMACWA